MARHPLWNEEYWLLLLQLYQKKPMGVTDFSTTSLMGEILKGYTFRFTSDGFTYSFKNCRRQAFLDVLQQEINK